ncbi:hypothetical protein LSAT2_006220 [Lamellibrachia satsuma]|nr:hypothetical protein LSAT2_006220 [Lamellibrachia satsuma]
MPDLTPEAKKVVQDTWAPVAANPKHFGVLLFLKYFKEYPRIQDFFVPFKGKSLEELKTSPKLRAHGTTVLHAVTAMVENLDDPDTMVVLLNNTAERHTPRTVAFPETCSSASVTSWPSSSETSSTSRRSRRGASSWTRCPQSSRHGSTKTRQRHQLYILHACAHPRK